MYEKTGSGKNPAKMLAQQAKRRSLYLLCLHGFIPANTLAFGKAKHMQKYFLKLTATIITIYP